MDLVSDILHLFYPQTCAGCGEVMASAESKLCIHCQLDLPYTDHFSHRGNSMENTFWGRLELRFAAGLLDYAPGTLSQRVIHSLKYKGNREMGHFLGSQMGAFAGKAGLISGNEVLVPVPLHLSKLKKRGYNQAEEIAIGVSRVSGLQLNTVSLQRTACSETQTRKNRFMRSLQSEALHYALTDNELEGRDVILIDDVITTGATLEAASHPLIGKVRSLAILTAAYTL